MICIGVDVSAKTLDVTTLVEGRRPRHQKFENGGDGHRSFIRLLKGLGETRVVMEATGVYHLDLGFALRRAGIALMALNPKRSKAFMRARRVNTQTDKIDSNELAEFALRMPFMHWQAPSELAFEIHKIGRAISRLTKESTRLKNQIHAESACQETPKVVIKMLKQSLALCEKQSAELTRAARNLLKDEPVWSKRFVQLLTVKGIAETSALALISELIVLPRDLTAKQWVKYAGLDPGKKDSGTSVYGKARIAKQLKDAVLPKK